jgi:RecA-family ATPase
MSNPPPTIPDVLPPHSVEVEEALLTAILVDENLLTEVTPLQLTGDSFYIEKNGWIFDAVKHLYTTGQRVNLITIQDELERRGQLTEVGGPAVLSALTGNINVSIYAAPSYARIIKTYANRRQWIEAAGKIARLAYDDSREDAQEQISQILHAVTAQVTHDWQFCTLKDAYKPREALQWVVNGVFALPSLNTIYGPPGTLKSMLMADCAVCVAIGRPWLTPLPPSNAHPFQTTAAPVLWLDFDNGQRLTHERFDALGKTHHLSETAPLYYVSMPSPWLNAADALSIDALAIRVNRLGATLVIIDNLGAISGGVDENSAEMIQVMANLRRLAEKTGAAIVVIHHQRKGSITKARSGDSLRGHSSIEAALDLALMVKRDDDDEYRITIESTKTRLVSVHPFAAQWTYEHKPGTVELSEAKFWGVPVKEDENTQIIKTTLLDFVKENPGLSQNKVKEGVRPKLPGIGPRVIRQQILDLSDAGQFTVVDNGNGKAAQYYINESFVEF